MANGYAVLDLETTGFNFKGKDRIVEIAVVLLDSNFVLEDKWTSLVNPMRDVGATSVHGITATDVFDAPKFDEISNRLCLLLENRAIVAHNASFDRNFLDAELARIGNSHPSSEEFWFCSKALSKWVLPNLRSYALANILEDFALVNEAPHVALGDALATAQLLQRLVQMNSQVADLLSSSPGSSYEIDTRLPEKEALPRQLLAVRSESSFIQKLVDQLPDVSLNPAEQEYQHCLTKALLDEVLSKFEVEELLEIASSSGLSVSDVHRIHAGYLDRLSQSAWADGVLTDSEKASLERIADLLGLGDIEIAAAEKSRMASENLEASESTALVPGSAICLTGSMKPDKAATSALLEKNGFVIEETFTKRISYLVAADVNSLSGKAAKARKYGIPVIGVDWVWENFS